MRPPLGVLERKHPCMRCGKQIGGDTAICSKCRFLGWQRKDSAQVLSEEIGMFMEDCKTAEVRAGQESGIEVPGLPAGVEVVRYGVPNKDEYVLCFGGMIGFSAVADSKMFIVRLKPGYRTIYNAKFDAYDVVEQFAKPVRAKITVEAKDSRELEQALAVKNLSFCAGWEYESCES